MVYLKVSQRSLVMETLLPHLKSCSLTYIPWRSAQQTTPLFWPREYFGQRSLAGYNP